MFYAGTYHIGHVTKYVCLVMNQVASCIFFKSHHISTLPRRLPPNQRLPLPSLRDVGAMSSPPTIAIAHVIDQSDGFHDTDQLSNQKLEKARRGTTGGLG
jgi:hypothetical protein